MANENVRIGIVQLQSHPAIRVGDIDYLCEPTIPDAAANSIGSLARTARVLQSATRRIRDRYLAWQYSRVESILRQIKPSAPHLLVFPECSLPLETLSLIAQYALDTDSLVIAGTHSPSGAPDAKQHYLKAAVSARQYESIALPAAQNDQSVIVVSRSGHTDLYPKTFPSVFERTNRAGVDLNQANSAPRTITITIGGRPTTVALFVCSEVLDLPRYESRPDLAVIVAYESDPSRYTPAVEQLRSHGVPVILVNDGLFGGSGVFGLVDRRMENWWFDAPHHGRVSAGDFYANFEVNFAVRSIETGVSVPGRHLSLQKMSPIFSSEMDGAIRLEEDALACAEIRNAGQLSQLVTEMEKGVPSPTTVGRWQYISNAISAGAVFHPQDLNGMCGHILTRDVPSLSHLELELKVMILAELEGALANSDADISPTLVGRMFNLVRTLKREVAAPSRDDTSVVRRFTESAPIVDQEEFQSTLRDFVLRGTEKAAIVSGLPSSGKSALIQAVLAGTHSRVVRIQCNPGATALGVLSQVVVSTGRPLETAPNMDVRVIATALNAIDVVWFEDVDNLCDPDSLGGVELTSLWAHLEPARSSGTKANIVFECRRQVDISLTSNGRLLRRRVRGLPEADGLSFFEIELRRAEVPLADSDVVERREVVRQLEGHPGLLRLIAEACRNRQLGILLRELRQRRGFFADTVRFMLKSLALGSIELEALSLLCEASCPLPASVIVDALEANDGALALLVARGLVQHHNGGYQIIGLLAGTGGEIARSNPRGAKLREFHERATNYLVERVQISGPAEALRLMISANYHAVEAGNVTPFDVEAAMDGVIESATAAYSREDFARTVVILEPIVSAKGIRGDRTSAIFIDALAWTGDLQRALQLADDLIARNDQLAWVLVEIARAAIHEYDRESARIAIARAVEVRGQSADTEVILGRLEVADGNDVIAERHFASGVRLAKRGEVWPYFYLSRHLLRSGRIDKALEVSAAGQLRIKEMRGRTSGIESALLSIELECCVAKGEEARASRLMTILEKRPSLRPESVATIAYVKAHIAISASSGSPLASFEEAVDRLDPKESRQRHTLAQLRMFRGMLLRDLGKLAEAVTELEGAIESDPQNFHMKSVLRRVLEQRAQSGDGPLQNALSNRIKELDQDLQRVRSDDFKIPTESEELD